MDYMWELVLPDAHMHTSIAHSQYNSPCVVCVDAYSLFSTVMWPTDGCGTDWWDQSYRCFKRCTWVQYCAMQLMQAQINDWHAAYAVKPASSYMMCSLGCVHVGLIKTICNYMAIMLTHNFSVHDALREIFHLAGGLQCPWQYNKSDVNCR